MSTTGRLIVLGSANQDLIVRTRRIPPPGETVLGGDFITAQGGKGANQAVAAARLGGEVHFIGRVGSDSFGEELRQQMTASGVRTERLRVDPEKPTGVALIGVDAAGQNAIMVAPGANARVSSSDVDEASSLIDGAYCVTAQLEIPLETVIYAAQTARKLGTRFLLNPAPACPLPDALLSLVDILTPNEHEAAELLGSTAEALTPEAAACRLLEKGVGAVIITLGGKGCLLADNSGVRRLPAFHVTPVDTTAAGDCFMGGLMVGLSEGLTIDKAAIFAMRAAALSVTRMGAQPSLPTRAEVDSFTPPSA